VERFKQCAAGAAAMTGATLAITPFQTPFADMVTNHALSDVYCAHLRALGEAPQPAGAPGASIDMGDVSYLIPSIHGWLGFGDPTLGLHTRSFAERTVTPDGRALLEKGALAMSFTGYDVLVSDELRQRIEAEFVLRQS
jgi:metal-dependent amidase/aminoacylase/carboxypeptidase family protein